MVPNPQKTWWFLEIPPVSTTGGFPTRDQEPTSKPSSLGHPNMAVDCASAARHWVNTVSDVHKVHTAKLTRQNWQNLATCSYKRTNYIQLTSSCADPRTAVRVLPSSHAKIHQDAVILQWCLPRMALVGGRTTNEETQFWLRMALHALCN